VDSIVGYRLITKYGIGNISDYWGNVYSDTEERISSYLKELDRVADLFNEINIPLVALKNSGIARAIYPYPGLVPMGDVDTLVRRSDFIDAHNILINNGYKIISPDKYHVADVNSGYRTGGNEYCTVLGDKKELRFELQWRSVEGRFLRPDQEPDGDELIDRSISVKGSKLRILSPEDNLLQVCLHTAKHSFVRAPGFRLHLDADRIINGQNIDWDIFASKVISHQVMIPTFFSLSIPKVLFNTNIPDTILSKIKPGSMQKVILTNWIKRVGIFNPHEKKFGKIGFLFWNAILYDSPFGLLRSIFPNKNYMMDRYLFSKSYYLFYYYIKRLVELIFYRVKT